MLRTVEAARKTPSDPNVSAIRRLPQWGLEEAISHTKRTKLSEVLLTEARHR